MANTPTINPFQQTTDDTYPTVDLTVPFGSNANGNTTPVKNKSFFGLFKNAWQFFTTFICISIPNLKCRAWEMSPQHLPQPKRYIITHHQSHLIYMVR